MTAIDIAAMPVAERLKLIEALWDSLDNRSGGNIASPAWHGAALEHAQAALAEGEARFLDWSVAKNLLRNSGAA